MCNASNHPPGCECGWGGSSYGNSSYSRNSSTGSSISYNYGITNLLESYTTPNAKCPECGEAVFFYQSSNGSSVFFDELGPPWPKHPCTDNSPHSIQNPNHSFNRKSYNLWNKNGWRPFIFNDYFEEYGKQRIDGTMLNDESETYFSFEVHHETNKNWFTYWSEGSPALIRKLKTKKKKSKFKQDSSLISYEICSFIFNKQSNFEEIKISLTYLSHSKHSYKKEY